MMAKLGMQNLILKRSKLLSDNMERSHFILHNQQKSMQIVAYSCLAFYLFGVIRNAIVVESISFPVMGMLFMLLMGVALFLFINYFYNQKIDFTQNGLILKKFLRKSLVIEWKLIKLLDFRIRSGDTSEMGSFLVNNTPDKEFIPNMKKFGQWTISIHTLEGATKIRLYNVPFSDISKVNPIIYSHSKLQYLSCIDLKNSKSPELLWSWKSEGTEKEKQITLHLLDEPAMKIEYDALNFGLEVRTRTFRNFLLVTLVVINPFVYILILALLAWTKSSIDGPIASTPTPIIDLSSNIDLLFITFLGIGLLIIFATYWVVLPYAMKRYREKGYTPSFFTFFLMFSINDAIVVFGLIIGILSWAVNDHVEWLKFILLFGIGWIQMLCLYGWKIPKDFRMFSFKFSKLETESVEN